MITCTRRLEFDAGHRVHNHESKCARLHGHRYAVELTARTEAAKVGGRMVDAIGRVIDFGVLKERVGTWLDEHWDHRTLLWEQDDGLDAALVDDAAAEQAAGIVRVPFNPTAENIAEHIGTVVAPGLLLGTGVEVVRVVVHETPNCQAEWSR